MNDAFKIYVDQLKDGHEENIHEEFLPEFIGITEKDLTFKDPVKVEGKAYLADDSLILNFDIETTAIMPCTVCNAPVAVEIKIRNFYHMESVDEIKSGIYNIQDILRETILIETPHFAECNNGKCSEREKISKYLKNPNSDGDELNGKKSSDDDGYKPFSNLELG